MVTRRKRYRHQGRRLTGSASWHNPDKIQKIHRDKEQWLRQKARYALRAMFSLARGWGGPPVMIADIAWQQDMPKEFLENILSAWDGC
jgi:hypothetical protein